MSVFARITNVMQVPMSEGVSYGMNYRSPGSVKICTVPLGYADGLIRLLSGQIKFAYKDRAVAQVGNICMDQCMFEVDLRVYGSRRRLDPMSTSVRAWVNKRSIRRSVTWCRSRDRTRMSILQSIRWRARRERSSMK